MLRESIEDVEPGDEDYQLFSDLQNGEYDNPSPDRPVEFLQSELAKRKKERADKILEIKQSLVKHITS